MEPHTQTRKTHGVAGTGAWADHRRPLCGAAPLRSPGSLTRRRATTTQRLRRGTTRHPRYNSPPCCACPAVAVYAALG